MATDEMRQAVDPAATSTNGARPTRHPVPVGPDAPIFEVMASMRAMRRLRPDAVPDELLRRVVEAARWAPSAAHMERYAFVVVTDRDQMAAIAEIWQAIVALYLRIFA